MRRKTQHFLDHRALSLQHFFGTDRSLTPRFKTQNTRERGKPFQHLVLDGVRFIFPLSKNLFCASPPSGWTILANITSKSVWFIYEFKNAFKVWDPLTLTPFSWTHERHIILLHTHVDSKASTTQVTGISKNLHVNKTIPNGLWHLLCHSCRVDGQSYSSHRHIHKNNALVINAMHVHML